MKKLSINNPVSMGIFLTYKCNARCKHCMYLCSPEWKGDWLSIEDGEKVLSQVAGMINGSPYGIDKIGVNHGLHFTGGEPFLNFELLVDLIRIADKLKIPSKFVETNCFWCRDDKFTEGRLEVLKNAGLQGILISVNPFILENIPFERTERCVRVALDIFKNNVVVYQDLFYRQFKKSGIRDTMELSEYLNLFENKKGLVELLPRGRAVYELKDLFVKFPPEYFFGLSCRRELTRNWHVHGDNYFNYIPGYCGGISLGDVRNIHSIIAGINLEERQILSLLLDDIQKLYDLAVRKFDYSELTEGYISKCHLCLDIRKHIVNQTDEFQELSPPEFYRLS